MPMTTGLREWAIRPAGRASIDAPRRSNATDTTPMATRRACRIYPGCAGTSAINCATTRQVLNGRAGGPGTSMIPLASAPAGRRGATAGTNGSCIWAVSIASLDAAGAVELECETLHVMDDKHRVALVETRTIEDEINAPSCRRCAINSQSSGLGESGARRDGALISYEEYSPYGASTFEAGRSAAEMSLKRYRYTGKERDEENGFTYHGARYYAPWLARWTACDPIGNWKSPNLYQYVSGRPIVLSDQTGLSGDHWINIPLLDELAEVLDQKANAEARNRSTPEPPPEQVSIPATIAKEAVKGAYDLGTKPDQGAVSQAKPSRIGSSRPLSLRTQIKPLHTA